MFYDRFKALCEAKGVSCKKAVIDIGLSNSIATKWKKTGATPNGETLMKIAAYFGISVEELLGNEKKPAPIGSEPLSLDYLRTLSAEQLLQIMKDATQALSEK